MNSSSPTPNTLRSIDGKAELIAPVELKATGNTVLEVQLSW